MASTTAADIAAFLNFRGRMGPYRQFLTKLPELALITYMRANPGSQCSWPVVFESADDTIFHTPGSDYATPAPGKKAVGALDFFEATRTAGITDIAENLAANSIDLDGIGSMKQFEVDREVEKMLKLLAVAIYTGDTGATPPELCGLDEACGTTTFAGINPGTSGQSTWVGTVGTATEAEFLADPVNVVRDNLLTPMATAGYPAKFVFTSYEYVQALIKAVDGANSQVRSIPLGNGFTVADIGGVGVIVDGTLFIPSPNTPSGKFYAVDPAYWIFRWVPRATDFNSLAEAISRVLNRAVSADVIQRLMGRAISAPPMWFDEIAKTGTQTKVGIVTHGQLEYTVRKAFGCLILS